MVHKKDPATDEKVIRAKNIGVSFYSGNHKDDYKSKVLKFIKQRGKVQKQEKIWPLKDINFEGLQGEILGIIGSNGAGKNDAQ